MNILGVKLSKQHMVTSIFKIILILIFGFVAIAGGLLVGKLIVGKFDTFDPTKYNASHYIESQENIALWSSKNISELTPTQIFCVAENKILNSNKFAVKTKGYDGEDKGVVITLGMKQDLYGYRYRNGNNGYFDYYSTGLATVVKKTEFLFDDEKYHCYEGTMNKDNTTSWTIKKNENGNDYYTREEYKAMTGCDAENPIDYIVSTKNTVLSEVVGEQIRVCECGTRLDANAHSCPNCNKEASEANTTILYSFILNLDPKTSVLNYVKKMDYMSGFGYPKFNSIELRFEVDENMNFQNIYINESYKVIGMDATSKYKMEFCYGDFEIR